MHTNQGSCFHAKFFIFQQRRGGAVEVARGRQIDWSHGSCLSRADQTTARQTEWAVECLSSCRVHSTQWKATHLVRGPLGQGISSLTLLNHHKWVTKSEAVRNLYLLREKKWRRNNDAWCHFCSVVSSSQAAFANYNHWAVWFVLRDGSIRPMLHAPAKPSICGRLTEQAPWQIVCFEEEAVI